MKATLEFNLPEEQVEFDALQPEPVEEVIVAPTNEELAQELEVLQKGKKSKANVARIKEIEEILDTIR